MTQSPLGQLGGAPAVKRVPSMDVYTGLLLAAFVVLLVGFITIAMANMSLVDGNQKVEGCEGNGLPPSSLRIELKCTSQCAPASGWP